MIGWLRTRVRKQPIVLYFELENELKFYNLEARFWIMPANLVLLRVVSVLSFLTEQRLQTNAARTI